MIDDLAPVRGRRRGPRWTKVSHGLYRPAHDLSSSHEDLSAWQLVLPPSAAFTHLTAAGEHGWWLPPLPADLPVFARMMTKAEPRPRREGLRVTRHDHAVDPVLVRNLRLAPPAETLLACATDLGLLDMVVLIDAALHLRSCTPDDVLLAGRQRRRGAPLLRRALRHADARSESAWESMLRMLHTACGVPVEPQYEVFDGAGRFVARGDLRILGTRVLHEYDGADHRGRRRHGKDLARERGLTNIAWLRRGYTAANVMGQAHVILREADSALGRAYDGRRLNPWYALLRDSLFTAEGTSRLRRRWGLADPGSASGRDWAAGGT